MNMEFCVTWIFAKYRPPFGEGFPFLENHAGLPRLSRASRAVSTTAETAAFSPRAKGRECSVQIGPSAHAACIELGWQPCTRALHTRRVAGRMYRRAT